MMEVANNQMPDYQDTLQAHIAILGISEKTISILHNAGIVIVQDCLDFFKLLDNHQSVSGNPDLVVMFTEVEPILIEMGLRERQD
jgi:hypothetical protein